MKTIRLGSLAACLVIAITGSGQAQQVPASSPSFDASARYIVESKSEVAALLLEAAIPLVGHVYAGRTTRGLLPLAAVAAGVVVIVMAPVSCSPNCSKFHGNAFRAGAVLIVGGRVWGLVSAYHSAGLHNAALRRRLNIAVAPVFSYQSMGVRVNIAAP